MWFFGDTARFGPGNELEYFEVGSAAWSPPHQPTLTIDGTAAGRPVPFATPTADFPACPAGATASGMWPMAAVVQPVGPRDRIIVWMTNICLGPGPQAHAQGMSVGETWYDPSNPPAGQLITVTMLNQALFDSARYGIAAFLDADGFIYTYGCDAPDTPADPAAYGPCRVARVLPADVADPQKYEPWDGTDWRTGGTPPPLEFRPSSPGEHAIPPPGPFAVDRLSGTNLYVMVYSPWPGFTDQFNVRVAQSPEGPWSRPAVGQLDRCNDASAVRGGRCYAANTKPFLDQAGVLGFGYYDQVVQTAPDRGAFLVGSVTYSIDPTGS